MIFILLQTKHVLISAIGQYFFISQKSSTRSVGNYKIQYDAVPRFPIGKPYAFLLCYNMENSYLKKQKVLKKQ